MQQDRTIPAAYTLSTAGKKATWTDCLMACDKNPKCAAWVFGPTKTCDLKTQAKLQYQKGYQAGTRTLVATRAPSSSANSTNRKVNTTIPSKYNLGASKQVNNEAECRALCLSRAGCGAWTLNPSNVCQPKTDAVALYQAKYTSESMAGKAWTSSPGSSSAGAGGAAGAASTTTDTTSTQPPVAATTTTPPPASSAGWWTKPVPNLPFTVTWATFLAVVAVLLGMSSSASMMMVMMMSSSSSGY